MTAYSRLLCHRDDADEAWWKRPVGEDGETPEGVGGKRRARRRRSADREEREPAVGRAGDAERIPRHGEEHRLRTAQRPLWRGLQGAARHAPALHEPRAPGGTRAPGDRRRLMGNGQSCAGGRDRGGEKATRRMVAVSCEQMTHRGPNAENKPKVPNFGTAICSIHRSPTGHRLSPCHRERSRPARCGSTARRSGRAVREALVGETPSRQVPDAPIGRSRAYGCRWASATRPEMPAVGGRRSSGPTRSCWPQGTPDPAQSQSPRRSTRAPPASRRGAPGRSGAIVCRHGSRAGSGHRNVAKGLAPAPSETTTRAIAESPEESDLPPTP